MAQEGTDVELLEAGQSMDQGKCLLLWEELSPALGLQA